MTIGSRFVGEGGKIVVLIGVPDSQLGFVLGKRGAIIQEIIQKSGAEIQVILVLRYIFVLDRTSV